MLVGVSGLVDTVGESPLRSETGSVDGVIDTKDAFCSLRFDFADQGHVPLWVVCVKAAGQCVSMSQKEVELGVTVGEYA